MPAAVARAPGGLGERGADGRRRRRAVGLPLLVALVVLATAELAVRVGHSHLAAPSAWPSPELQKKYDQIVARASSGQRNDVVLVGDSMMDAAGDPAGLDAAGNHLSVYNAAVAGETLPTIAEWTTKVVVPRLHPRVVVIGLSSNELNPSVLSPAQGQAAYHGSRAVRAAEGTGGLLDQADAFLRQWSLLYRYRTVLRHPLGQPASGTFDPRLTDDGHDLAFSGQRYLSAAGVGRARLVIAGVVAAMEGFTVGPDNVALLQRLITSLRNQGVQVLLVAMPVTPDLVSFHPGGAADYQRALAAFASIAQAGGSRYSVAGVWPVAEFADPVHLNGVGTARFSAYLAPLLAQAAAGGS